MDSADMLLKSMVVLQILLFCCVLPSSSSSSNTISVNQTLKDDGSVLVSAGGRYTLGFFSPGKSTLRYIGIWFSFSNATVVWVANRDAPINDTSGILTLSGDGNLILSASRIPSVWSANVTSSSAKAIASFSADGNLAVVHNENEVTWQSFDHPTHVLLAGMKVGLDLRTGLNRVVTAWKSADDPGSSEVFLRMDTAGSPPQLVLYKNRSKWWRAGHWNGLQWSGVPALGSLPRVNLFNITFTNDGSEITVAWNVLDSSLVTFVAVNASGDGSIRQSTWQGEAKRWVEIYSAPGDICDPYAVCGPNGRCDPYNVTGYVCSCLPGYHPWAPHDWALRDSSGGCGRRRGAPSMCRAGEGFARVRGIKVPDAASAVIEDLVWPAECRNACLENCSCLGYGVADVRGGGSGCMMWHGDALMDVKQFLQGGQDLFVRVDSIELDNYKEISEGLSTKLIAVIVGVSIGVFLISICSVLYCLRKRKKLERMLLVPPPTLQHNVSASSDQAGDNTGEKSDIFFFDLSTVAAATDNFSSANKLGQGGFGAVYKGVLGNGQELAVKRLSQFSGQGTEEFKNEVVLIAKLQHRNLVKLIGCCINNEEKMLVYEYMPNKSLDLVLFDQNKKLMLDWRLRSQIVLGIARGLLYLHQDSRLKIIHRDLKASNVLLDATMTPKISDFGMARMFGDDQIEANTNKVVGTYGYMSPEYAMEGLYSTKSDVFSFGVLILEILTGKKNSHFNEVSSLNLVGQVWDLWTEKRVIEIVDETFDQSDHHLMNHILRWIHIGLLCVQELAVDRPIMSEVIFMLGNESLLPSPKRPAFIFKNTGSDTSTSKGVSVNNITITVMEPR